MLTSSHPRRRQYARTVLVVLIVCFCRSAIIEAQIRSDPEHSVSQLAWSTDSTGPRRFLSVHGRRAAIFGYSEDGLEVWAYPMQILSSYTISFCHQGATTGIDGATLLRRIIYSPEAVTRIYAGPDFIVREKLFVPLDLPGAIIRYEVDSVRPVDIVVHFVPALDLMWPASIGGQEALWSSAASAYRLSEPTHRFTATVGSPDIVAHDDTPNSTQHFGRAPGLAFTTRAGAGHTRVRVIVAGGVAGQDAIPIAKQLLDDTGSLEAESVDHYSQLQRNSLQVKTPDTATNRALAWSEIALDQAWVCNPDLGCGLVAGYGPSRKARRPQYDWFFAGDGLVTVRALLAAGQYNRARQELEFILKYQDQKTGMIWHELSQSAGQLDWTKYPYMFVHVDLTFEFITTLGDYLSVTGDRDFVRTHWSSIQTAYEYCRSLLDPKDGLPRIPPEKLGQREQQAFSDELSLSASWISAAQAFSDVATATGHTTAAEQATSASQRTRHAIGQRYWDEAQNFWIAGHTRSGAPLMNHDLGPLRVLATPSFSQAQRDAVLGQISSADFQADWGTRGRAAKDRTYDPNSYAGGSVWATGTSATAAALWAQHRPATALPIWSGLVSWTSLDSLGHMHEALAGDYYHEELESVPEQTWSSATFFSAGVKGLLGLQVDGMSNRATFAPHLPSNWHAIKLRNWKVGTSEIDIDMVQTTDEIRLQIHNEGLPVTLVFAPEIPLGAKLLGAQLGSRPVVAAIEQHPQDTHARVEFNLPHGDASLAVNYIGGVAIVASAPNLAIGDSSKAIKITGTNLTGRVYTVDFDYLPSAGAAFEVHTPWRVEKAQGATFETVSPALYRLTVNVLTREVGSVPYQQGQVILTLAGDGLE